jgi:hypothetical protein
MDIHHVPGFVIGKPDIISQIPWQEHMMNYIVSGKIACPHVIKKNNK